MRCLLVTFLLAIAAGTAVGTQYPAIYFSPSYLSKAASVPVEGMKATLRGYSHAKQGGTAIPVSGSTCNIQHDELTVSSVDFTDMGVTPLNDTHVRVLVNGVTPLNTTVVNFGVGCQYGEGAFVGALELQQSGSISFSVNLGLPQLQYDVAYQINQTSGSVSLTNPVLANVVKATSAYTYSGAGGGYALDAFVASYFEQVVVQNIEAEVTAMLSYPNPFSKQWFSAAQAALSVAEFVCGATPGFVPSSSSSVFYMQPGCGPDPSGDTYHTDLLQKNDMLVILPSSNGAASTTAQTKFHQVLPTMKSSPAASSCSSVPGCNYQLNTTAPVALNVNFADCTVCYPDSGRYTELSGNATFSFETGAADVENVEQLPTAKRLSQHSRRV